MGKAHEASPSTPFGLVNYMTMMTNKKPLTFICSACAACCKRAGTIPGFPEPVDAQGVCLHLQADGRCSIYEQRPLICRVDKLYKVLGYDQKMSLKDYYIYNNTICNEWIRADQLDEKYLINYQDYNDMEDT